MKSYQELLDERDELNAKIKKIRDGERSGVIAEIKRKMAEYDISVFELVEQSRQGKIHPNFSSTCTPVPAKYRDPKTGAEWSGEGKVPRWIKSAENYDDYLIENLPTKK